ncbi:MAG: ABC transporter permease, partial [Propionibacteriales bacterium]|nr:ABC transporter permease [Propionibacteriales bacterium]
IMISVGFVSTILVFLDTETNATARQVAGPVSRADLVITTQDTTLVDKINTAVDRVDGVDRVEPTYSTYGSIGRSGVELTSALPDRLQWQGLDAGRWPGEGEIAVSTRLADSAGVSIGDQLAVSRYGEDSSPLRVVGILPDSTSLLCGLSDQAVVAPGWFDPASANTVWAVTLDPGADPATVRQAIESAMPGASVATSTEYAQMLVTDLTQGVDVYRAILLVFGAIALLVSMMIISNTFTILIAQRRRQIGLLRAVGAGVGQVRRSLLGEALIIGAIGSVLGVLIGIGLGAAGAAASGSLSAGLRLPPSLAAAGVAGLAITVLAALVPALRTSAVMPLEALRSAPESTRSRPIGMISAIGSVAVLVGGIGLLVWSFQISSQVLLVTVAGSFLLALAVLMAAPVYVPLLIKVLGVVPARLGTTGRLAAVNAVRNPRRTAATSLALMLAVGLIVTLQVGSASVKASAVNGIDNRYPVPLIISSYDKPLPPGLSGQLAAVTGVGAATEVISAEGTIGNTTTDIQGLAPDASMVINDLALDDHTLLVGPTQALDWVTDGQQVSLTSGDVQVPVTVRISRVADSGPVTTAATVRALDPRAKLTGIWCSVPDRTTEAARATLEQVNNTVPDRADVSVGGSLAESVTLNEVLDALLLVATVLLGAAVAIALIGVGNTLGLSVLERTRESALLRALGMYRGQLRAMLAIEALLLALVGALVGILAGIGFGWLGARALLAEMEQPVVFAMSWPQTALDVLIAAVAGLAASVLPAHRAAQASPTEALAEV